MILITIPTPDVTITKQDSPELSNIYGFRQSVIQVNKWHEKKQ
jgi:hypothetical protein